MDTWISRNKKTKINQHVTCKRRNCYSFGDAKKLLATINEEQSSKFKEEATTISEEQSSRIKEGATTVLEEQSSKIKEGATTLFEEQSSRIKEGATTVLEEQSSQFKEGATTIFNLAEQHSDMKEEGTLNVNETEKLPDITSDELGYTRDENMATPEPRTEEIDMLLLQNRFRAKLEFERNFLHEYLKHRLSVPTGLTSGNRKAGQTQSSNDIHLQSAAPQYLFKKASLPLLGSESRRAKSVYPPSYWLTCTYRLVREEKYLNVIIRQTGTLPELQDFKLTATVYIDQENETQRLILAKSHEDKSFRSHEINFRMQNIIDLTNKTLFLKMYMHKIHFVRICVGEWDIELTDCSEKEKIVCKKFFSDID